MIAAIAAVMLATPAFAPVRDCEGLPPLKWESWLYRDDDGLFRQERFVAESEWRGGPDDVTGDGVIRACFGIGTPHSRDVVVHHYPPAPFTTTRTRPVLLVTGAGDNALRSMSFLAVSLSHAGFRSYALTFAHPHGDNFLQAEHVANALGFIAARHPGVKIDVIAYSKGGMAARVYASNGADVDWRGTHDEYHARGTRYRGDIGRLVLVGAPNGGIDTAFRWTAANLFPASGRPLDTPTSWTRYYPQSTASPLVSVDLSSRSIYRDGGNHFPGQAQMLADLRAAHPLPGGNVALGAYGAQPDYYTTYEGGLGFYSLSPGIRQAIDDGGDTIARLQSIGIDPDIELSVVGGGNPIIGTGALGEAQFESGWGDLDAAQRRIAWEDLVASWLGAQVSWVDAWRHDLPRLFAGTAFLAEISGPSDGLVFIDSALETEGLTRRGAQLKHRKVFQALNHAELIAAGTLASSLYGNQELAGGLYDPNLAEKYDDPENQAVEWYLDLFAEPVPETPPPTGDAAVSPPPDGAVAADAELPPPLPAPDAATPVEDDGSVLASAPDAGTGADAAAQSHDLTGEFFSGSCQAAPGGTLAPLGLLAVLLRRRRFRR